MFFMGVLGWPPYVVMQEASLEDLSDAYEGYARFHGILPSAVQVPSGDFLQEMMKKFPDIKEK